MAISNSVNMQDLPSFNADIMNEEPIKNAIVFRLEGLMNLFLRVIAIIFLLYAIRYWMLVVGFTDPDIRFDVMPVHWKISAATLSVLYPVAALGLWGLFRWGIVIWFITVAIELIMYLGYPDLFGQAETLVIFHMVSILTWLIYEVIRFAEEKRALLKER